MLFHCLFLDNKSSLKRAKPAICTFPEQSTASSAHQLSLKLLKTPNKYVLLIKEKRTAGHCEGESSEFVGDYFHQRMYPDLVPW